MIWALILAALAALALVPQYQEAQRHPVTAADRAAAPGKVVTLTQGETYIRWHGPVRGPVIVAIHGLTTPSQVFDDLAGRLALLGYRILTYDLYGRGLSDRVPGPQNAAFFLRQLDDLLTDQQLDEDVILLGYSMGGAIAAAFAAAQPHRVGRVILLASAGMEINEPDFWRTAGRLPVLGDWLAGTFGASRLASEIASPSPLEEVQRAELTRRGYIQAVLSSRRHFLTESQETAHRLLGREDVPVAAIWGGQDPIIPLRALGTLAQWNRNTVQEVVTDADHSLPWRHAEQIVAILRQRD
ncbi:alpha/beta fold hydrolase [Loktanella sp. DJP18]|uniref:alpha/beta fold hydrolase n=1 Tax=Loktanella sp. DJP18 TaxID=3409788 RepID=UPI003BB6A817